jgi:hypothetical protein
VATLADVVAAIDHIMKYKPNWRGTLNDADFNVLNKVYQWSKENPRGAATGTTPIGIPSDIDDKYLGALRLDNPTLFDGARLVDPPPHQPAPGLPPPTQTPPPEGDGFSGRAAEASKRVDEALAKNKNALNQADEELVDAVLGAKTGSDGGKARLLALQNGLIDQIHKLGPSLDTPAGQQQLNDYLQGKTQEIMGIVKSSSMDAESKAEVLDALAQRYDALKDSRGPGPGQSNDGSQGNGAGQAGAGPVDAAQPPPANSGPAGSAALANDPLLNGLPSDPLMGGLGALAGPGMGALAGLPAAMGSMLPGMGGLGGGGGAPLGDLGGVISGAIKEAAAHPEDSAAAREQNPPGEGKDGRETNTAKDEPDPNTAPNTAAAAAKPAEGDQHQPVTAEPGQAPPAPLGPDVSVKLPDGSTVIADRPQLAHFGRLVLEGASVDDAAGQAKVTVLPASAPVTDPVSPSQLRFGDYAQFTDHRVMALGGGKVWSEGQVTAIDQMPTGPNFLGWARPQVETAPSATVLAGVK